MTARSHIPLHSTAHSWMRFSNPLWTSLLVRFTFGTLNIFSAVRKACSFQEIKYPRKTRPITKREAKIKKEITKVQLIDIRTTMSFQHGPADSFSVLHMCTYHQTDLFFRVEKINVQDRSLRSARLSSATFLRALYHMHVFDDSREELFVTVHHKWGLKW